MDIQIGDIELVKSKANCSYNEALIELRKTNGKIVDAILNIKNRELEKNNKKKNSIIKIPISNVPKKKKPNKIANFIVDSGGRILDIEPIKISKDIIGVVGAEVFNVSVLKEALKEYNSIWEEYDKESACLSLSSERLYEEREKSIIEISKVEKFINSIANTPKSFDNDIAEIKTNIELFKSATKFAEESLEELKQSGSAAGMGVMTGAGIVALAPSAAMAVATTFGTASTGTAISALSGAAATNAAVAWLGGGAIAAGGGGMVAGNALLALAGPIGWSIAATSVIGNVVLLSVNNKKKAAKIHETTLMLHERVIENKIIQSMIDNMIESTMILKTNISKSKKELSIYRGKNYSKMDDDVKKRLGAFVNNTRSLSASINTTIEMPDGEEYDW